MLDQLEERLASIERSIDCPDSPIRSNAISPLFLEEIGIRRTDLVIALTQDDATNLTVCQLADFYHVPRRLARVRNLEYIDPKSPLPPEQFGVDYFISPEGLAVEQIGRIVACPGAVDAIDFEEGRIALRAFQVSEESSIAGETIMAIDQSTDFHCLIAVVRRGARTFVPSGQEKLRIGDTVYVVCEPDVLDRVTELFNGEVRSARKAVIYGANITGIQLARQLARQLNQVLIIEPDALKADSAAHQLDDYHVEVLHGSALDLELLTRSHVDRADYFIAVSDNDEANLTGALLFLKYGNGTPIVLTNQAHYVDILESVDLDIIINPRLLATSTILRHIRGAGVLSVAKLHHEEIEAIELQAAAQCKASKKLLRDLKLPKGILVAAVLRDQELHVPRGDFQIQPGDRVLMLGERGSHDRVSDLLR